MSAEAGGNDIAFERTFHSQLTLEKLHKVEGQFKSEMVDFGTHPTKDLLEKDKCYLLDCGPGSVYVWLGTRPLFLALLLFPKCVYVPCCKGTRVLMCARVGIGRKERQLGCRTQT